MQLELPDDRRWVVQAGLFLAVLVVLAGCSGGDTTTHHDATPVTVENSTALEANYRTSGPSSVTVNATLTLNDSTHTVLVTSHATTYAKNVTFSGDGAAFATFTVVSSPNVSLGNASLNPVAYGNHSQILETFESNATGVTIGDRVGNATVTALGGERTVSRFEGEVEVASNASDRSGATFEVYVHVARFEHEDDHVVVIAAYPRSAPGEREAILAMIRALEHSD